MREPVLVNGAGVVGLRVASSLLEAGVETGIVVNSLRADNRRVHYLQDLLRKFPGTRVLATQTDPETTRAQGEGLGIKVDRALEKGMLSDYTVVFDGAHEKGTLQNFETLYEGCDVPVVVQGATPYGLYSNDFVMAPNAVGFLHPERFKGASCRKVSCNATYLSTMMGLLLASFKPEEISNVEVYLFRRHQDPEDTKAVLERSTRMDYGEPGKGTKHARDVRRCVPSLDDKISTFANKNPWRHYHRVEAYVYAREPVHPAQVDSLRDVFRGYPRAVYAEQDLVESLRKEGCPPGQAMSAMTSTLLSIDEAIGIPDGDHYLGIYTVNQPQERILKITGLNPQRSIVVPDQIDYVHLQEGLSAREAFDKTNASPIVYGRTPLEVKAYLEKQLA